MLHLNGLNGSRISIIDSKLRAKLTGTKSWGFGERIHYFRVIYGVSKTPGFVRTCRDVA